MKRVGLGLFALGGTVALALAAGCGGAKPVGETTAVASKPGAGKPGATTCARQHPGVGATRLGDARQSSAVALARHGATTVAYVADEDSSALHTVDVDRGVEVASTKLAGAPAHVLVLADGRVAVTLRNAASVQVLEPASEPSAPLASLCQKTVPAEPFGLAATPDDKTLLVTSAWRGRLSALDSETLAQRFAVDLPREPRAVLVDDAGERAFVSHVVGGKLSVVDLASGEHPVREVDMRVRKVTPFAAGTPTERLRSGTQGFALAKSVDAEAGGVGEKPTIRGQAPKAPAPPRPRGRIFAPMATVDPGDANVRSQAYYGEARDGVPKEAPIVGVVDASAERTLTRTVMSLGTVLSRECLLPRAAATRASTGTLLVTCLGIDALVELDTRGADPARLERHRWALPAGPLGLAVDDAHNRAVVWSQFEGKVAVVNLDGAEVGGAKVVAVSYAPPAGFEVAAKGRELFHLTDDRRIANDGVACASCHPDGREDALTWSTPDGPRQTIMLAGRMPSTAPYGWLGKHGDLKTYITNTFGRLGGTGIVGPELDALASYLDGLSGPAAQTAGEAPDPKLVEHGKELFFGEAQGCASCHVGGPGTDKTKHDVASLASADVDGSFDTPSLRFVRGTAPYFHDGRYKTLEDMLSANDTQMGHTSHLPRRDLAALKAYLETL